MYLGLINELAAVDLQVDGTRVGIAEVHLGGQRQVMVEKLSELHHHGRETSGNVGHII